MINLTIISDVNKTVDVVRLSDMVSLGNFSGYQNHFTSLSYDNIVVNIVTNTDAVTLSNFFSGLSGANSSQLGYVVVLACIITFLGLMFYYGKRIA